MCVVGVTSDGQGSSLWDERTRIFKVSEKLRIGMLLDQHVLSKVLIRCGYI